MLTKFPSFITMLPVLSLLALTAFAQPASGPAALPSAPAGTLEPGAKTDAITDTPEQLMTRAMTAFELHRSFSAQLRHQVNLFGQNLVGKGTYYQLGHGLKKSLRVEMQLKASGQGAASQLAHVCDGQYLWTFEKVGERSKLSRVDLRRVSRAIDQARRNPAGFIKAPPSLSLGSGGLGRLLADLNEQFEMHSLRPAKLGNDSVWVLDGRWRKERLAKLLPDKADRILAGKSIDLEQLPPHLPHEVRLTLSRDAALLPFRVEFARTKPSEENEAPERIAVVSMETYEIKVNEELDPHLFVYKPGSVEIVDRTEKFLVQRGLKQAEKKK